MTENVNNCYFDGLYKEIWRQTVPEQATVKEIKFLIEYFGLTGESRVIDLMCGFGRHSISLAAEGIHVTAIDNLKSYTDEIKVISDSRDLNIEVINSDILTARISQQVDLSICMGNSLNFFEESDILAILTNVFAKTKKGGFILINTWSLTEIVVKGFIQRNWEKFEDLVLLSESKYNFQPTRITTQTTIYKNNAVAEVKSAVDYIFSLSEMEKIINQSGFKYQETFSIPGKKHFEIGDPRAYIIGKKL